MRRGNDITILAHEFKTLIRVDITIRRDLASHYSRSHATLVMHNLRMELLVGDQ